MQLHRWPTRTGLVRELRGLDSDQRSTAYEAVEIPNFSTPQWRAQLSGLRPQVRKDSNPQRAALEAAALPLSYGPEWNNSKCTSGKGCDSMPTMDDSVRIKILRAQIEDIDEQLEELRLGCLHYGPPLRRKWNHGDLLALCGLCGGLIK